MNQKKINDLRALLAPLFALLDPAHRERLDEVFRLAGVGAAAEEAARAEAGAAIRAEAEAEAAARREAEAAARATAEKKSSSSASTPGAIPTPAQLFAQILAESGRPMGPSEIAAAALERGWKTTSASPRNVVGATLSARPEFIAVARGVYTLRDAPTPAPVAAATPTSAFGVTTLPVLAAQTESQPPAEPAPKLVLEEVAPPAIEKAEARRPVEAVVTAAAPSSRVLRETDTSASASITRELEFFLQQVEDARADTAVLAPPIQRLQITAWIARARALRDLAPRDARVEDATGRVAGELGELCKLWWPGSVEALKLDSTPMAVLRQFSPRDAMARPTWIGVADALDAQLEAAWAQPNFDDGWSDSRALCDDERFVEPRLVEAEELLARLGTPANVLPPRRADAINITRADEPALLRAVRGLRWVRGVVTDGARWGLIVGRFRFLAANHPALSRGPIVQALFSEFVPGSDDWGFADVLRAERQQRLLDELERKVDLLGWLSRAIDHFDTPELARRIGGRSSELAAIDVGQISSRRVRGRVRKLLTAIGVAVRESAANPSVELDTPAEASAPEPAPQEDGFASIRRQLHEKIPGRRALFISNREDAPLRDKVAHAFGLDVEWCVASPRRIESAADAIRRGSYDVILSATGFQDHSMDIAFARAAKDASTLYVRVNRGRPAACARAIARELGMRAAS